MYFACFGITKQKDNWKNIFIDKFNFFKAKYLLAYMLSNQK